MKTKHTPGEWKTEEVDSEKNFVYMRINSSNKSIGFAGIYGGKYYRKISEEEAKANAKLMAAAPVLLEALIELHSAAWDNGCSAKLSTELKKAMQAIKKATE